MSDPAEDRILQDYLHRKSALSMGYRRVYIEEPPEELDRAITARARRALRWLLPGLAATVIVLTLMIGTTVGVTKLIDMMVSAEKTVNQINKERKEAAEQAKAAEEKALREGPVSVAIDANDLNPSQSGAMLSRDEWLAKIEQLKKTGTTAQVEAEQRKYRAVYPESK